MNKKFSTLLAAFLVAGGLGSSAFADDLKVKTSEYFQLKDAHDHYLIVGEGAVRDSLALVSEDDFKSLNDLNKTLWRISVETQKDANGFVTGNKYYLENKVNGGVALTYANASEDLSQYYAPGAVVAAGKWEIKPYTDPTDPTGETKVEYSYDSKTGVVTLSSNVLYFGTLENVYDAAAKEAVGYKLAEINGIIKLAK